MLTAEEGPSTPLAGVRDTGATGPAPGSERQAAGGTTCTGGGGDVTGMGESQALQPQRGSTGHSAAGPRHGPQGQAPRGRTTESAPPARRRGPRSPGRGTAQHSPQAESPLSGAGSTSAKSPPAASTCSQGTALLRRARWRNAPPPVSPQPRRSSGLTLASARRRNCPLAWHRSRRVLVPGARVSPTDTADLSRKQGARRRGWGAQPTLATLPRPPGLGRGPGCCQRLGGYRQCQEQQRGEGGPGRAPGARSGDPGPEQPDEAAALTTTERPAHARAAPPAAERFPCFRRATAGCGASEGVQAGAWRSSRARLRQVPRRLRARGESLGPGARRALQAAPGSARAPPPQETQQGAMQTARGRGPQHAARSRGEAGRAPRGAALQAWALARHTRPTEQEVRLRVTRATGSPNALTCPMPPGVWGHGEALSSWRRPGFGRCQPRAR